MQLRAFVVSVILTCGIVGSLCGQEVRVWTDKTGQYRLDAGYVSHDTATVTLKKRDGTIVEVPIDRLSQVDVDHIRQQANGKPVPGPQPASTRPPEKARLDKHREAVSFLAFRDQGKRLLSGGHDGQLIEWDLSGSLKRCPSRVLVQFRGDGLTGFAMSPNGEFLGLACGKSPRQPGTLYQVLESGDALASYHNGGIFCLATAPDGHIVAIASSDRDGEMQIKTVSTKREQQQDGPRVTPISLKKTVPVTMFFAPSGKELAVLTTNRVLTIYDLHVRTTSEGFSGAWQQSRSLVVSQEDLSAIAIASEWSRVAVADASKTIRVWDLAQGVENGQHGCDFEVNALRFVEGGSGLVAVGGSRREGELFVVDTKTWKKTYGFSAHRGPITSLAFSHDGGLLATGSNDGQIRLWDWSHVVMTP